MLRLSWHKGVNDRGTDDLPGKKAGRKQRGRFIYRVHFPWSSPAMKIDLFLNRPFSSLSKQKHINQGRGKTHQLNTLCTDTMNLIERSAWQQGNYSLGTSWPWSITLKLGSVLFPSHDLNSKHIGSWMSTPIVASQVNGENGNCGQTWRAPD